MIKIKKGGGQDWQDGARAECTSQGMEDVGLLWDGKWWGFVGWDGLILKVNAYLLPQFPYPDKGTQPKRISIAQMWQCCRKDGRLTTSVPGPPFMPLLCVKKWLIKPPKLKRQWLFFSFLSSLKMLTDDEWWKSFFPDKKSWKAQRMFKKKINQFIPDKCATIILQRCCREPIRVAHTSSPSIRRLIVIREGWEEEEAQLDFSPTDVRKPMFLRLELLISNLYYIWNDNTLFIRDLPACVIFIPFIKVKMQW